MGTGFSTKNESKLKIRSLHHWAKPAGYKEPATKSQGGVEGDEEITSAGELLDISERLAEGRKLFSIHGSAGFSGCRRVTAAPSTN